MSRASTQPRVEYVCGLLQGVVTGIARSMAQFSNLQEIAKLTNEKIAVMTDDVELADLRALKERKIDKGRAANRVLLHAGEYFTAYAEQARMFDVRGRGALVELTGVLPRGAQPGGIINIARSYGREMYVLTVLQRTGDVEPITLNVLSTVWNRLKGAVERRLSDADAAAAGWDWSSCFLYFFSRFLYLTTNSHVFCIFSSRSVFFVFNAMARSGLGGK